MGVIVPLIREFPTQEIVKLRQLRQRKQFYKIPWDRSHRCVQVQLAGWEKNMDARTDVNKEVKPFICICLGCIGTTEVLHNCLISHLSLMLMF